MERQRTTEKKRELSKTFAEFAAKQRQGVLRVIQALDNEETRLNDIKKAQHKELKREEHARKKIEEKLSKNRQ